MLDYRVLRDIFSLSQDNAFPVVQGFYIGNQFFDFSQHRYLVGVINLSEDSFYRESVSRSTQAAIRRAEVLLGDGADIIDIGAESTRSTARKVGVKEQIDRLVPVISTLVKRKAIVSVESYYAEVLEACASVGAQVFNVTGKQELDNIFNISSRYNIAVIICYICGMSLREVCRYDITDDMIPQIKTYFKKVTGFANKKGTVKCIIDPCIGFYHKICFDNRLKTSQHLKTYLNCFRLHDLGYPVINSLPLATDFFHEDERRSAEPFFSVLSLLGGSHILRTHEIRTVNRIRLISDAFSQ